MRTYSYKAFDAEGRPRRGLIEAADTKAARERLASQGLYPEWLGLASSSLPRRPDAFTRRGVPIAHRAVLYKDLSVLIGSGLPLIQALDILLQSPELAAARSLLAGAKDGIREGRSLADSLAAAGGSLTDFEHAMIEVGEKTGSLDAALDGLSLFLEAESRLRQRAAAALVYPSIVLVAAAILAVIMLGFALPAAGRLLEEQTGAPPPALLRAMIGLGRLLMWGGPFLLVGAMGAGAWARRRWRRALPFRERLERLLFRIPMVGRGRTLLVNLRFSRTLALLLRSGMTLVEAIPLAGRATGSAWLARLLLDETENIRQGGNLAEALRRIPPLSESLPAWALAGEASGALEHLMNTAAAHYQYQWERHTTRALSLLEPLLIAVIGLFVLLVTLSVLLPILALNQAVDG